MSCRAALQTESVFGENFKSKCSVCLGDSGWMLFFEAKVWEKAHARRTAHVRFSFWIRKHPISNAKI